jgi:hypothetical protein
MMSGRTPRGKVCARDGGGGDRHGKHLARHRLRVGYRSHRDDLERDYLDGYAAGSPDKRAW